MNDIVKIAHENQLGIITPNKVFDSVPVFLKFVGETIFKTFNDFNFTIVKDSDVQNEKDKFTQVATRFEQQEAESFSSRGQLAFRKRLTLLPWLTPFIAGASDIRIEQRQTGFLPKQTNPDQSTSIRTFISVPICFVIFFTSTIIAANRKSREIINKKANAGVVIPHFLLEKLKSVRQSDCNDFFVTPTVQAIRKSFIELLQFEKTIIDLEWLTSEEGIDNLFTLYNLINASPNNYVKMSIFDKPIQFYAGQTTTESSISITHSKNVYSPNRSIPIDARLLPGNSFPKEPNGVQINDAFVIPRTIQDENDRNVVLKGYSLLFTSNMNDTRLSTYIVDRVTGKITNDPKRSKVKQDQQEEMDTSSDSLAESGLQIKRDDFKTSQFSSFLSGTALMLFQLLLNSGTVNIGELIWFTNNLGKRLRKYRPSKASNYVRLSQA